MFFQSINSLMTAGTDLSINIRKVGEQLVVSTLPRNNNLKEGSQSYLIPLTASGTPMELDAGYLQAIMQPIQKAGGLLINLEQFEKQAEKAASKPKTEKPKADNEANEGKEKLENYNKCLKKADELTTTKHFSEALTYLKQAKTFATPMQQTDLAKKIKAVELELSQGSLFGAVEEPKAQAPQPILQQTEAQRPQFPQQQQIQHPIQQSRQPQQPVQPMQQRPIHQPIPAHQPEQPGIYQPQQTGYYQPAAQQQMPQPMQQPVIHPAQFSVTANGQPLAQPVQQRPAPMQQHPIMQPTYNPAPWNENDEDQDTTSFREDPYAGYPDFPQEYRMRDEAQLATAY